MRVVCALHGLSLIAQGNTAPRNAPIVFLIGINSIDRNPAAIHG